MFGRLGRFYMARMRAGQDARRFEEDRPWPADPGVEVFLRLFGVVALGCGACGLIALAA